MAKGLLRRAARAGALIVALSNMLACSGGNEGGGGNPAAPSGLARANIAITDIAVTGTRTSGGYELRVVLRLKESGGQAATVNSAAIQLLDDGGTVVGQGTFDNPLGGSNRIAPRQELSTRNLIATADAPIPYPSSLRVTVNFVDDGQASGTATGQSPVESLRTATIVGVVRNGTNQAPLPGATVAVTTGSSTGRTTTTDGNGFYSLPVDFGPLNLRFEAPGFSTVVRSLTVSGDATVDVNLVPPTAPARDVEYRVRGSRADLTYANNQGGTAQESRVTLPWTYSFSGARSGQFLYISAQNTGDSGPITVEIYRRGVLFRTTTSSGAFAIATASGSY